MGKKKLKSSSKRRNFPKILVGSAKLRNQIKAKTKAKNKRRQKLLKKRLICEKCGERFTAWWDIWNHWRLSGHKEPEECRWCRKKTYTLQGHLCKEHWDLACMCTYCGQLFMFTEGLREHERLHNGSEYRCYICGKRKKNHDLLRKHIYKHYVYERYGCNVCEKRFKKKKNVEKHLIYVHFICQYCGSSNESKKALVEHWKSHDDLKCVLCHKVFSQKSRLKYHYQMQHGHQDFYKCSLCFQRFPTKSKLLNHLKLKHKGHAKISCETCDMPFLYWSQYLSHFEQVHATPVDKFFCSFCDFSTNMRCKLQWHIEKTSGDGFFCKVCQIRLQCKTKFDEHMKIHEGKRVFKCDHCDRSYATADILKYHVSVKHQEVIIANNTRGYPCLILGCDRYYVSKSSLARHMRKNHAEAAASCSSGQFCADNTVTCRFPLTVDRKAIRDKYEETIVSSSTQLDPDRPSEENSSEESTMCDKLSTVGGFVNGKDQTSIVNGKDQTSIVNGKDQTSIVNGKDQTSIVNGKDQTSIVNGKDQTSIVNGKDQTSIVNGKDQTSIKGDMIYVDVYYCDICCKFWFAGDKQFRKHMTTHKKQVWDDECMDCEEILESPEDAVRHYVEDHLKAEYMRFSL